MDIAAGTTQTEQAARFPKGVPAMSDENMTAWMQYVYMQQPKPTNAVGAKVHVTAIDSNGNYQDIGTVTSNIQGNFAIDWKPPVPGLYTVTATFEGSKAYYGSEAGTSFEVQPKATAAPAVVTPAPTQPSVTATPAQPTNAPTVAPTPSPIVIPPTSAAPTVTYIAIGAVVIILIAVAAAFILRRRT
jgi:hypothetical protein